MSRKSAAAVIVTAFAAFCTMVVSARVLKPEPNPANSGPATAARPQPGEPQERADDPIVESAADALPSLRGGPATVYSQAPNQIYAFLSDPSCNPPVFGQCATGQQTMADNFTLTGWKSLEQLIFWGGYGYPTGSAGSDNFTVTVYANSAGNPGTSVYSESGIVPVRALTGQTAFGFAEWQYTATLTTPPTLAPNTTYWIEIINAGTGDQWAWESGNGPSDNSRMASAVPAGSWAATSPAYDLAFQLIGSDTAPPFPDCNNNGIDDADDILSGTSEDCDLNTIPDECDIAGNPALDCDNSGTLDVCDVAAGGDCNTNGVPDSCDIGGGSSADCDSNGTPDECDLALGAPDCNANGVPDDCDLAGGSSADCDSNGFPDECDIANDPALDCDANGAIDFCEVGSGSAVDCDANGIPDVCDIANDPSLDCNANGLIDDCEVASGTAEDCNNNGIPDDCELTPVDILYAVDRNSPGLYAIDLSALLSGGGGYGGADAVTLVGYMDQGVSMSFGMSVHPATGAMYAVVDQSFPVRSGSPETRTGAPAAIDGSVTLDRAAGYGGGGSGRFLARVNKANAQVTIIGEFADYISDIAFRADGTLYGVTGNNSAVPGEIVTISTSDASTTSTGLIRGSGGGQSIAFQPDTGLLYLYHYPVLETIDVDTGAANLISASSYYEFNTMAFHPSGSPFVGFNFGDLFLINPSSGALTPVDLSGGGGGGDRGIGFVIGPTGLGFLVRSGDCNGNGIPDDCDIADGTSTDCDGNGVPDSCEPDCNTNGITDACDITAGTSLDCNTNGVPDECDISSGSSADTNANGIPDDCEDCNYNGVTDDVDISGGTSQDCNTNGIPDECELADTVQGLYGVARSGVELYQIDPANGASTLIGFMDQGVYRAFGLSIQPGTGVLYTIVENGGISRGGGGGSRLLATVDRETAAVNIIGNLFDYVSDLAFRADGTLYGIMGNGAVNPGEIVTIDTGDATVTSTGIIMGEGGGQSIAFQPGTGLLYHMYTCCPAFNGATLSAIDVDTQNVTTIATYGSTDEFNALTFHPSGRPLLGFNYSSLYEIDPDDGALSYLGDANETISGAAFFGSSLDCNGNGILDECDIASGTSEDCDANGTPDECQPDCNTNGVSDGCDIVTGTSQDCNANGIPDECDLADATSRDCNSNGIPDECDTASGTSGDCNNNGIPDDCELSGLPPAFSQAQNVCAAAEPVCIGITYSGTTIGSTNDGSASCAASASSPDVWYTYTAAANGSVTISMCGSSYDTALSVHTGCPGNTGNQIACNDDSCGLQSVVSFNVTAGTTYVIRVAGYSSNIGNFVLNLSGTDCVPVGGDCNTNGIPDDCDVAAGTSTDCNGNQRPDDCEIADGDAEDCNTNGFPDACDISSGTSEDCNTNDVPDECESVDCNNNGTADQCDISSGTSEDCNQNGVPDECDVASGASEDCDANLVPDECQIGGGGVYFVSTHTADFGWDTAGWDCGYIVDNTLDWLWQNYAHSGSILLIRDNAAWHDSWRRALAARARPYTEKRGNVVTAADFAPGAYDMIIITDYMDTSSLPNMNTLVPQMEAYVQTGGVLVDIVATNNAYRWSQGIPGPFGTRTDTSNGSYSYIVAVGHGMLAGMSLPYISGNSDHHGRITTVPANSILLTSEGTSPGGLATACWLEFAGGGGSADCNHNQILDECELGDGSALDCNTNGIPDDCDIADETSEDCNLNAIPDECDIAAGTSIDCNSNGQLDDCEVVIAVSTDFTTGDGIAYQRNGSAQWVNQAIRLTSAGGSQMGSVIFPAVAPDPLTTFVATFNFRMGGGSGADGMSFAVLDSSVHTLSALFGETGAGSGSLSVEFDTFQNPGDVDNNHLDLRLNGTSLATYTPTFNLDDNQLHEATVALAGGAVTVILTPNGGAPETAFNAVPVPGYSPFTALYGFGGRTGGGTNEHWVDNVLFVRPDANDCNVNGVPDECDIAAGTSTDVNANGIPDECEPPPMVTAQSPEGVIHAFTSFIDLTFSAPLDPATFTVDDIVLTGPSGAIVVDPPVDQGAGVWRVGFAEQTAEGAYSLTVGPDINSFVGHPMEEAYNGQFCIIFGAIGLEDALPHVTAFAPTVTTTSPFSTATVTFSRSINAATFTPADVVFTGPNGTIPLTSITPASTREFTLGWAPQTQDGSYQMIIGPNISDVCGFLMDQDLDGTGGEATVDRYTANILMDATPPTVLSHSPAGPVHTTLSFVDITFSEAMNAGTVGTDDVTLTGPSGPITINSVTYSSGNTYRISFAGQAANGDYMFSVGPNIADIAGSSMAAPYMFTISMTLADLTVTQITAPSSGGTNQQINITWTVDNIGPYDAVGSWTDRIYLSSDAVIGGDIEVGSLNQTGPIAPGVPYTRNRTVTIPGNLVGNFYVVVIADANDTLVEQGGQANNGLVGGTILTITDVTPPDTTITAGPANNGFINTTDVSFQWTGSDNITAVGNLVYSYCLAPASTGCDLSNGPFTGTTTAMFSGLTEQDSPYVFKVMAKDEANNTDPSPATRTFTVDLTPVQLLSHSPNGPVYNQVCAVQVTFSEPVLGFEPADVSLTGPSGAIPITQIVTTGAANTYEFRFACQSAESAYNFTVGPNITDRAGNPLVATYAGSFTIALPDLQIVSPGIPTDGYVGQQINVPWTVVNGGNGPTNATWNDCVFLSTDDQFGGDTQLTCQTRPNNLNPGQNYNRSATVTIPNLAEGNYWLLVRTDGANNVFESNEGNNVVATGPINIRRANLTINPSLVLPQEGWTGQQIAVGWTVNNAGVVPAAGTWQDCIYLSTDDTIGGDTQLACIANPVNLGVGEHYDRIGAATIPAVTAGQYWIVVKANGNNGLVETDTNDNTTIDGPFMISETPCADLRPTNLVIPTDPVAAGGPAFIDWLVTNIGNGGTNAPFWKDRMYLSLDQNFDGADITINPEFPNPTSLNAGESYPQNVQITIPSNLVGNYYVIVRTDYQNSLTECDENNNTVVSSTRLAIEQHIPPVLTMTNCQVNPPNPFPGTPVTVSWTITNTGEIQTGPFNIDHAIVLSTDNTFNIPPADRALAWHIGQLSANLLPGQTSQPISVNVTIPTGIFGDHFIFVWPDPPQWVNLERQLCSVPITIQPGLPADLEVYDFIVPPSGVSGQPVGINWTVINSTIETTPVPDWQDRLYLSRDNSLATTGDNILLGTYRHDGYLGFFQSYTAPETGQVILPNDADGPYYVIVQLDYANRVYEGQYENNNVAVAGPIDVTFSPPDLQVQTINVTQGGMPVSSVLSGTSVAVQWTVANTGTGGTTASSWVDRIHISTDDTLDGADPVLANVTRNGALNPGQTYTMTQNVTIPVTLFGAAVRIIVQTDVNNAAYEVNNNNNVTGGSIFEVIWAPADLIVENVGVTAGGVPVSSVTAGTQITVDWTVRNNHIGATQAGSWVDRIAISSDGVLDGSDPILGTKQRSGSLAADGTYSASFTGTIPVNLVGPNVRVFVVADINNQVYESSDSNNTTPSAGFEVLWGLPNLLVDAVSAPGGALAGQSVAISWTIRNSGGPTTAGTWSDRVYLSNDRYLSGDDTPFDPVVHTGDLAYNTTYIGSTTVVLPGSLPNPFYLIVKTDSEAGVAETDEANNSNYATLALTPLPVDLRVTSVDAPETALSGQQVQLTWTVKNFGIGSTPGAWRDAVYLSLDQFLDRNTDIYLGFYQRSGSLAPDGQPNDSYTRTQGFAVPNGLSGPYFVFVSTDINSNVAEQNAGGDAETNNVTFDTAATVVEIPPPADLVVTSITVPSSALLGDTVNIQWMVRNDGQFQAQGSWHDAVYISADGVWDIGDKRIGDATHTGAIDPGSSYALSLNGKIPGVVPGDYQIIIRTDAFNEVRESITGEQNNATGSENLITVDCFTLNLGVPETTRSLSGNVSHFYKIPNVPSGEDMLIELDSLLTTVNTELYVRYGAIPDRGHFDFAYSNPFAPDQDVLVPSTLPGTYFVLAYGYSGGPSNYSLAADLLAFEIVDASPDQVDNAGSVTLKVRGAKFESDMTFQLIGPGGTIESTAVELSGSSIAFPTFNVRGLAIGFYDLQAKLSDDRTAVAEDAVEVVSGPGGQLTGRIVGLSAVRPDRHNTMEVRFANIGRGDVHPPLVVLKTSTATPFGFDPDSYVTGSLVMMGVSQDGPANVLRAGENNQFFLQYLSSTNTVGFQAQFIQSTNTHAVDFVVLESNLRPAGLTDGEWAILYQNFQQQIDGRDEITGATYGELVQTLGEMAQRLAKRGHRETDATKLVGHMINVARGRHSSSISGKMMDMNTGDPLGRVRIRALPIDGDGHRIGRPMFTMTEPDGSFVLEMLSPGTYEVTAAGYWVDSIVRLDVTAEEDIEGLTLRGEPRFDPSRIQPGRFFPPGGAPRGNPSSRGNSQFQQNMATLSGNTYAPSQNGLPPGYTYHPAPGGGTTFNDPSTGFQAAAYTDANGNLTIAFRGTEGSQFPAVLQDAWADAALGGRQWTDANRQAVFDYVNNYVANNPGADVNFTGHSLGGGLAQWAAYDYAGQGGQSNLTTFNGVGVVDGIAQRDGFYNPNQLPGGSVDNYIVNGDLVGLLGGGHVGGNAHQIGDGTQWFGGAHSMDGILSWMQGNGLPVGPDGYQPPYLQIEDARQFLDALANFGNFDGDAGAVESAARLIAALAQINHIPTSDLESLVNFLTDNLSASGVISQDTADFINNINWPLLMAGIDILDLVTPIDEIITGAALTVALIADAIELGIDVATAIYDGIVDIANTVADAIDAAIDWGIDFAEQAVDAILDFADAVGDAIVDIVDAAIDIGTELVNDAIDAINDAVETVTEMIEDGIEAVEDFIDDVVDTLEDIAEDIGDTISDIADTISDTIDDIADTISDIADDVSDWIDDNIISPIDDFLDDVSDTISDWFDWLIPDVLRSRDPNDIIGPAGYGEQHWVTAAEDLPYTIRFENASDAAAPAGRVTVTHQLSPNLDWRTFQLGQMTFSNHTVEVPAGRAFYVNDVANAIEGIVVRITAGIDLQSGLVTWTLQAIDPATGEQPENALLGLLPPNNPETHDGEGALKFTIRARRDVPTGTEALSSAVIIFDTNEPIPTNEAFVTIDKDAPSSNVAALPAESPKMFDVQWSGADPEGGSGLSPTFQIYVSEDNGPYGLWQSTTETLAAYTGARGGSMYSFYSLARDNAGNLERALTVADAATTIAAQTPLAPDLSNPTAFTVQLNELGDANADHVEHAVFEANTGKYVAADGSLSDNPAWQSLTAWQGLVIQGLTPLTSYSFASKARSASGETLLGPATDIMTAEFAETIGVLTLNTLDDCLVPGGANQLLTVTVDMTEAALPIVGGQFYLTYDNGKLDFLDIQPASGGLFTVEASRNIDEVAGTIDYAVNGSNGNTGTIDDSRLAVITFNAIGETCADVPLVSFRSNDPPTQLSAGAFGSYVPDRVDLHSIRIDGTAPAFAAFPADINRNADARMCSAALEAQLTPPTATDSCTATPVVTFARSDGGTTLADPFQTGMTTITWTATDDCGNSIDQMQTVTVNPLNDLMVDVQLSPALSDPNPGVPGDIINRCIRFELWECPTDAQPSATVDQEVAFPVDGGVHLAASVPLVAPCGNYTCITARDPLHSLRSTAADFGDDGVVYSATFSGSQASGGHWLVTGNLNGDNWIDIVDFALFINRFGVNYGSRDTTCATAGTHADLSGNGTVGLEDFTFIQINFLRGNEPNCCGLRGMEFADEPGPRMMISVKDLEKLGLGDLSNADFDGNGWIDQADVAEFMGGARP